MSTVWNKRVRISLAAASSICLSVVGISESKSTLESWVFGFGVVAALAYLGFDLAETIQAEKAAAVLRDLIEPESVRKRCHGVLKLIAEDLFKGDLSLRLVVFLPRQEGADALFVPIVIFDSGRPLVFVPDSKARFRTSTSTLIRDAWNAPGKVQWIDVPTHEFESDEDARGWYQNKLKGPREVVERLSHRTLRETKTLGNIGLALPTRPKSPIGLLAITSGKQGILAALVAKEEDTEGLRSYLETVAFMLAPA